jgi:hypothetical protein
MNGGLGTEMPGSNTNCRSIEEAYGIMYEIGEDYVEGDSKDWWADLLKENFEQGQKDADKGMFDPPYPGSDDPQDETENTAYADGFSARRKELGESFKWA